MKLTKESVEKAGTPDKGQIFYWDDTLPGFGLRVTATGARSYIVQSRANGKTRRATIGRHGVYTAEQARKRARAEMVQMSEGVDPAKVKKRAKVDAARDKVLAVTLTEVMEDYLRDRRELKERSRKDIQYHVEHSFSAWIDQPAASITRDMVSRRFRKLSDRSPAQANQAMRNLRALLNYARAQYRAPDDEAIIGENPVDVLSQSRMWNKSKAKNTYVPIEQIGRWWTHVEALRADESLAEASRAAADLVAFLALSGLRIGEARALRWNQVDKDDASLKLHDTKNRTDVTLPLSRAAIRILEDRGEGTYVFPARSGEGYLKDARATLEKLANSSGVRVTAHDLRRTFRAVAGECNVELWRTKALMNHSQKDDVTLANYTNLEDVRYLRPDADTIGDWIERQGEIASRANVVAMERRA